MMMMKQSSLIFAAVTFLLFPWLVDTYNLRALSLFEPSSSSALDLFDSGDTISSLIRRQQEFFDNAFFFRSNSPGYEIVDDNEKWMIELHLPNVQPEDVEVNLEGRLLTIRGREESNEERYSYSSHFSRSFTLDENVELDKISATIDHGVLTIAAPKDPAFVEKSKLRRIPVKPTDGQELAIETNDPVTVAKPEEKTAELDEKEPDPFHVKERVARAARQRHPDDTKKEPSQDEEVEGAGYKMGELRGRR